MQLVTLANVSAGTAGAVLSVQTDADATACETARLCSAPLRSALVCSGLVCSDRLALSTTILTSCITRVLADTYLEACMRAVIDGADKPLFLSSGGEDYYLSAYYFNQGEFKTPNSGLTYKAGGRFTSNRAASVTQCHCVSFSDTVSASVTLCQLQ